MTREEALRYWEWHLERAEEWSDPHWEASERKAHKEYVDAMKMAIEALSNANQHTQRVGCVDCNDLVYRAEVEKLKKKIKSLDSELSVFPSADRPTGWIPVSERLPKYRETVLISTFWGVRVAYRDTIKEDGTDDFWYMFLEDSTAHPRYVYAWMPLPEPYKERNE